MEAFVPAAVFPARVEVRTLNEDLALVDALPDGIAAISHPIGLGQMGLSFHQLHVHRITSSKARKSGISLSLGLKGLLNLYASSQRSAMSRSSRAPTTHPAR